MLEPLPLHRVGDRVSLPRGLSRRLGRHRVTGPAREGRWAELQGCLRHSLGRATALHRTGRSVGGLGHRQEGLGLGGDHGMRCQGAGDATGGRDSGGFQPRESVAGRVLVALAQLRGRGMGGCGQCGVVSEEGQAQAGGGPEDGRECQMQLCTPTTVIQGLGLGPPRNVLSRAGACPPRRQPHPSLRRACTHPTRLFSPRAFHDVFLPHLAPPD